jgi:hypothetical protein
VRVGLQAGIPMTSSAFASSVTAGALHHPLVVRYAPS